ncbi:transcriptional regulator, partial [Lactobacillus salivarius]|nr:transcriptional regulator [Ligilactobacillus salivarius]
MLVMVKLVLVNYMKEHFAKLPSEEETQRS